VNGTMQHRGDERQVSIAQPHRSTRAIYRLPARALWQLGDHAPDEQARGHIAAQVTDTAIELRVDWDGNAASPGRFEVRVGAEAWQACELIDTGALNDVVSPSTQVAGSVFLAHFLRGPVHASVRFGVKAIPIVWTNPQPASFTSDYVAERGKDYTYEAGVDPLVMPWTYSVLAGSAQRLTLELATGRDYEVWVRLQDPKNPDHWQVQDPIVHTGAGGGNPH
jgi:hypothetical protein